MGVAGGAAIDEQATVGLTPLRELNDHQLVSAVRGGRDAAFEELYRRYRAPIWRDVSRMVKDRERAEEITQDVFLSALNRMGSTDAEIFFRPWLFQIARNACIDLLRRQGRATELTIDGEGELAPADQVRLIAEGPTLDTTVIHKERFDHLQRAWTELPEKHQRMLVLRELEGRSYNEIASRMELSLPAVESSLVRARRRLKHEYQQLDTGARCAAITAAMTHVSARTRSLPESRKLARHLRRCRSCRRTGRELGIELGPDLRSRAAALLPLPGVFERLGSGRTPVPGGAGVLGHAHSWLPASLDGGAMGLAKAVAVVAAAIALGGGGAAALKEATSTPPAPSQAGVFSSASPLLLGNPLSQGAGGSRARTEPSTARGSLREPSTSGTSRAPAPPPRRGGPIPAPPGPEAPAVVSGQPRGVSTGASAPSGLVEKLPATGVVPAAKAPTAVSISPLSPADRVLPQPTRNLLALPELPLPALGWRLSAKRLSR